MRCWATAARAARPLASGALPELLGQRACKKSVVFREAGLGELCGLRGAEGFRLGGRAGGYKNLMFGKAELELPQT